MNIRGIAKPVATSASAMRKAQGFIAKEVAHSHTIASGAIAGGTVLGTLGKAALGGGGVKAIAAAFTGAFTATAGMVAAPVAALGVATIPLGVALFTALHKPAHDHRVESAAAQIESGNKPDNALQYFSKFATELFSSLTGGNKAEQAAADKLNTQA
ncbi:MAG: hypothetical protein VKJ06_05755 [Vampirovibrionales bacterium]|nr:hypothetical protein [Vampirovibrionales bacterium]